MSLFLIVRLCTNIYYRDVLYQGTKKLNLKIVLPVSEIWKFSSISYRISTLCFITGHLWLVLAMATAVPSNLKTLFWRRENIWETLWNCARGGHRRSSCTPITSFIRDSKRIQRWEKSTDFRSSVFKSFYINQVVFVLNY